MKFVETNSKRPIGVITLQLFLCILLARCVTFHFSDHQKRKVLFPVKDRHVVTQSEFDLHQFDLYQFNHPDSNQSIQYISPKDIDIILKEIDTNLLLIYYFPDCSLADTKEVPLAKFAEKNNIPYLLISDTYSLDRMKNLYQKHELNNKNLYIIPTRKEGEDITLKKRSEFIKSLSPDLYSIYKDELIFTTLMIVSKNRQAEVNPLSIYGFQKKPLLIDWIKEKYGITD